MEVNISSDAPDIAERHPFVDGPFTRPFMRLRLPLPIRTLRGRILTVLFVCYLPIALLAAGQGNLISENPQKSFLFDAVPISRYLLALPLLLIADVYCLNILARLMRHFGVVGLVPDSELPKYQYALQSTRRMLNTPVVEILIFLLVAVQVFWSVRTAGTNLLGETWRGQFVDGSTSLTLAGWWNALVSLPIYLIVVYGWVWRVFLWGRCVWFVSRLRLDLRPSHPDQVAGLGFLREALNALPVVGFAFSCIPAGGIFDLVRFSDSTAKDYQPAMLVFAGVVMAVLIGPLYFFAPMLLRIRTTELARLSVRAMEQSSGTAGRADSPEFTATCTQYNQVAQLQPLIAGIKQMPGMLIAVCSPFVIVLMTEIPLMDILDKLKLLIL